MRVTHFLVSAIPDNPAHAADGKIVSSNWNADHVIEFDSADVITALGYTPVTDARTVSAGAGLSGGGDLSANRTISLDLASANVWTATQTVPRLVAATGAITASEPVLDLSQTWNNAAVTFYGIKLNVTDTASVSASMLLELQVGGSQMFGVRKNGTTLFGGTILDVSGRTAWEEGVGATTMRAYSSFTIYTTNTPAYLVVGDAAQTVALRNGTNAQTFRVYGTYTDSSNYVRASLSSSSTTVTLAAETAGTGADDVSLVLLASGAGSIIPQSTVRASGASIEYQVVDGSNNTTCRYNSAHLEAGSGHFIRWRNNVDARNGSADSGLARNAAGVVEVNSGTAGTLRDLKFRNVIGQTGYSEMVEMTAPAAGAANTARIFAEDNGSGKTRIMAQFASGAAVQIAIEP